MPETQPKKSKKTQEATPLHVFQGAKMEKLRQLWERDWLGCQRCVLSSFRIDREGAPFPDIVFGEGNPDSKIMIIGEAPGAFEEESGVPFVGDSGRLLNQILASVSDDVGIQELWRWFNSTRHTKENSDHFHEKVLEWRKTEFFITNTVGCFPGATLVQANGIEKGYRRWYEGNLSQIWMEDGHTLSSTPNHPVLTPRGLVPLHLLHEGDYVVRRSISEKEFSGNPDVDHRPTTIEEIFQTLLKTSNPNRIAGAEMDFHGDGRRNCDIDVVTSKSKLSRRTDLEAGREILKSLSGQIKLVRIIRTKNVEFRGYVYNLTTHEGWYTAGDVVVSNCRPPDNRTPTHLETKACWERLYNIIYIVDPWLIITSGKPAAEIMIRKQIEITKARGSIFDVELPGRVTSYRIPIMATLHPSYLLRQADWKNKNGSYMKTVHDFMMAVRYIDSLKLRLLGIPLPTRLELP